MTSGPVIQVEDLPESIRGRSVSILQNPGCAFAPILAAPLSIKTFPPEGTDDAARILAVLRKHNNNRRRAATELGMSRVSLYKKLHRYGLFVSKSKRAVQSVAAG
jgi:transcriptional regulator of acetoin/glycerol metabolism